MKPKCPKCGSLSHNVSSYMTRTLMNTRTWTDEQGNTHHDDPNITTERRTCRKCGRGFRVKYQNGEITIE